MAFFENYLCSELAVPTFYDHKKYFVIPFRLEMQFQFDTHFYFSPLVKFMSCESHQ